jgi:hypothetical protein
MNMVLQADDESLTNVISLTETSKSFQERLEVIGLALIHEILSPTTGFLCRLISSESIEEPKIGTSYFESWYERRVELISKVLSERLARAGKTARRSPDALQAAKQFLALMTQLPQTTALLGMRSQWNSKSVQGHAKSAVECFLKAYPNLA